jgi:hypothetical protein
MARILEGNVSIGRLLKGHAAKSSSVGARGHAMRHSGGRLHFKLP